MRRTLKGLFFSGIAALALVFAFVGSSEAARPRAIVTYPGPYWGAYYAPAPYWFSYPGYYTAYPYYVRPGVTVYRYRVAYYGYYAAPG